MDTRTAAIGFVAALTLFFLLPEAGRWIHGDAFAQAPSSGSGDCTVGRDNNGAIVCHNSFTIPERPTPIITEADILGFKSHIPAGAAITILKYINDDISARMEEKLRDIFMSLGYQCCGSGTAFVDIGKSTPKGIDIEAPIATHQDWRVFIGKL